MHSALPKCAIFLEQINIIGKGKQTKRTNNKTFNKGGITLIYDPPVVYLCELPYGTIRYVHSIYITENNSLIVIWK